MLTGRRALTSNARARSTRNVTAPVSSATWRVLNGKLPLVGMEQLASAIKGTPVGGLLHLHSYCILQGPDEAWLFDFLPLRPTSPATALLLLTAGRAPGEVRVRRLPAGSLQRGDSERLRLVGPCTLAEPLAAARQFNACFDTNLHLLHNNCSHHTKGLTQLLLGGAEQEEERWNGS